MGFEEKKGKKQLNNLSIISLNYSLIHYYKMENCIIEKKRKKKEKKGKRQKKRKHIKNSFNTYIHTERERGRESMSPPPFNIETPLCISICICVYVCVCLFVCMNMSTRGLL